MSGTVVGLIAGCLAYLAGSIPFGYFVGLLVRKDDIRKHGSGNIGATNVARVLGKKWGIFVLLMDALKGALPTLLVPKLFDAEFQAWLPVVCGVMTVVGHMFPIWLKFKGGKGVATALGVGLVLSWQATLVAFVVFLLLFAVTRQISVGSMGASIAFCATQFVMCGSAVFDSANRAMTMFAIAVPVLIIVRHRSNIVRLLKNEEPKFGDPVAQGGPAKGEQA